MELIKNESPNLDLQRARGLFLGLLEQYEGIPLCSAKTEIKSRFGLALSDDQLLEIVNRLLSEGRIRVSKLVSRGQGFFDAVIRRSHQGGATKAVSAELDEMQALVETLAFKSLKTVLDIVRERPGLKSEIIDAITPLIGDHRVVIEILDKLEKGGIILVDREHESGEPFISTLS